MAMTVGYVCRVIKDKGFCFVKFEGQDYFLHKTDFSGFWEDLVEDYENKKKVEIEFKPTEGQRGLRAQDARRLDRGI